MLRTSGVGRVATALAAVAVLLAVTACGSGSGGGRAPGGATSSVTTKPVDPQRPRLIVMVEENHALSQVIGKGDAVEINALSADGVSLTNMYATTHPSLPNYLAMTSGSTHGATNDCGTCTYPGDNLFSQMERAHISWGVYAQGYPGGCDQRPDHGDYVRRHVPPLAYREVLADRAVCNRVVPLDRLWEDVRTGALPTVVFVIPDLVHDMHGRTKAEDDVQPQLVRAADELLGEVVRSLHRSPVWHPGTRFVLTWDEGGGSRRERRISCCGGRSKGGHIPTIVVGPDLGVGQDATDHDQYDLLRSIEDRLHLPRIGEAAAPGSNDIAALVR